MATVLISGGTGLIGKHLTNRLREKGYQVAILSRSSKNDQQTSHYTWDISKGEIDKEAIAKADYIIHLAGVSVGDKRWTNNRKRQIIESRIKSGKLLYDEVKRQNKDIKAFISASAIGYYGTLTSDKVFIESDPPGNDFLGQTCRQWEDIADKFSDTEIRTVKIRIGVVLSERGGALSKMAMPIKYRFGSALGSGKQYIPWIHMDDLLEIYIKAIEDVEMQGAYNAVAPEHITNKKFTHTIASILKRRLWFLKVPAFVLKILFGQMSSILLEGSRVSSQKIQDAGYKFLYSGLEGALKHLKH